MMKYSHKTEAEKGTFDPIPVTEKELVLTSVSLNNVSPGDRILLKLEVGWDKPLNWDMGELEIMIRKGRADGPIVFLASEACFYFAHTKLEHTERGGGTGHEMYYLTVRSVESRCRITGPYSLEGIVYIK
jgi:hypothetical protein